MFNKFGSMFNTFLSEENALKWRDMVGGFGFGTVVDYERGYWVVYVQ